MIFGCSETKHLLNVTYVFPTGFYSREENWWTRWKENRRQRKEKGEPFGPLHSKSIFKTFCGSFEFLFHLFLCFLFSVVLQKASSDSDSDSVSGSEKKVVDSDSEDEKPRPALSGSESQSGSKSESDSDPPPRKGPQARKKGKALVLFFSIQHCAKS